MIWVATSELGRASVFVSSAGDCVCFACTDFGVLCFWVCDAKMSSSALISVRFRMYVNEYFNVIYTVAVSSCSLRVFGLVVIVHFRTSFAWLFLLVLLPVSGRRLFGIAGLSYLADVDLESHAVHGLFGCRLACTAAKPRALLCRFCSHFGAFLLALCALGSLAPLVS